MAANRENRVGQGYGELDECIRDCLDKATLLTTHLAKVLEARGLLDVSFIDKELNRKQLSEVQRLELKSEIGDIKPEVIKGL